MKKFQVHTHVSNIVLLFDGKPKQCGYYQMFKIEAETAFTAKLLAIDKIKNDGEIASMAVKENGKICSKISIENIYEVDEFDSDIKYDKTGRIFYLEKQWWQIWKFFR